MASVEERNLDRVRQWEWNWNNDVMRMVDECYAADCVVIDMLRGRTFHGREELRAIEEQMISADVSREMNITNTVASGNAVATEMDALWDKGTQVAKSCVFLTFDDDGMIKTDHSYGGDPTNAAESEPRPQGANQGAVQ